MYIVTTYELRFNIIITTTTTTTTTIITTITTIYIIHDYCGSV